MLAAARIPPEKTYASACTPERYKTALRHVPAPVAIITTLHDGEFGGMTATAVCSVSAAPPQILVCVNRDTRTGPMISASGRFAVNFLAWEHRDLAMRFSQPSLPPGERFADAGWTAAQSGTPILPDAVAAFDCQVVDANVYATHTVFIGQVVEIIGEERDALLYRNGQFHNIQPAA